MGSNLYQIKIFLLKSIAVEELGWEELAFLVNFEYISKSIYFNEFDFDEIDWEYFCL